MIEYCFEHTAIFIVICVGVGIRSIVSLSSYSGASVPPLYGDYEAQRHWQEITFNLPANQWYLNTTDNDLLYWGLDYPPLTAYHSLIVGIIASQINKSYVELSHSRGFESSDHKSFMRFTVLAADLLLYIPAVVMVMSSLKSVKLMHRLSSVILLVFYPCQILVDSGHFQYNNISLALFLFTVQSLINGRHNWAAFAFSLALNYKQMELYHAMPIFVYLLKAALSEKSIFKNVLNVSRIGLVTLTTFTILWMPWISSVDSLKTVVLRLFPLSRGVFEDKVANMWCSLNIFYKFKENLQNQHMALICLATTFITITPTNLHLFFDFKKKTFLYTLVNTSLAFFLFSFQVHEKSVLLAAVPSCFLFEMMPFSVLCFLKLSTFSILPLLIIDKLHINYFCMNICYLTIFRYLFKLVYSKNNKTEKMLSFLMDLLAIIILTSSFATIFVSSPQRYPFLWSFVISAFCCIFFLIFLLETNFHQYICTNKPQKHINSTYISRL